MNLPIPTTTIENALFFPRRRDWKTAIVLQHPWESFSGKSAVVRSFSRLSDGHKLDSARLTESLPTVKRNGGERRGKRRNAGNAFFRMLVSVQFNMQDTFSFFCRFIFFLIFCVKTVVVASFFSSVSPCLPPRPLACPPPPLRRPRSPSPWGRCPLSLKIIFG